MHHIEHAIVRIYENGSSRIAGVGLRVTDRHILTAAHVVTQATGTKANQDRVPGASVELDFPLVQSTDPHNTLPAVVGDQFRPRDIDIALLELRSAPPSKASIARVVPLTDYHDIPFEAYGIPQDLDDGVWATGTCRRQIGNGLVQIDADNDVGYFLEPGFSGGPVYNKDYDGVIGLVLQRDPNVRSGRMIPTTAIMRQIDVIQAPYSLIPGERTSDKKLEDWVTRKWIENRQILTYTLKKVPSAAEYTDVVWKDLTAIAEYTTLYRFYVMIDFSAVNLLSLISKVALEGISYEVGLKGAMLSTAVVSPGGFAFQVIKPLWPKMSNLEFFHSRDLAVQWLKNNMALHGIALEGNTK